MDIKRLHWSLSASVFHFGVSRLPPGKAWAWRAKNERGQIWPRPFLLLGMFIV
jgi:hypothetical protein